MAQKTSGSDSSLTLKPMPRRLRCANQLKARSVPVATSKADEYRARAIETDQLGEQTVDSVINEEKEEKRGHARRTRRCRVQEVEEDWGR